MLRLQLAPVQLAALLYAAGTPQDIVTGCAGTTAWQPFWP